MHGMKKTEDKQKGGDEKGRYGTASGSGIPAANNS